MKKMVLGVKIDDLGLDQAVQIIASWLSKPDKHYIVTTNPEFIMTAQKDPEFKSILNNADLAIPDGRGLKLTTDIENTTPGTDLLEKLIKLAADKAFTTGFLGGRDGVAKKAVERLKEKYPNLQITFIAEEPSKIPNTDLLFIAFGHPKQEKWIAENLQKIPVKVAMGVGGSFDYLSGKIPRAPKWIRSLGIEWLFRLVIQPWRIKRQLALLKYLMLIFLDKFGMYHKR